MCFRNKSLILDKYVDALSFKNKRRPYIGPAVYNLNRLFELPIPITVPMTQVAEMEEAHSASSDESVSSSNTTQDEVSEIERVPVIAEVFCGVPDFNESSIADSLTADSSIENNQMNEYDGDSEVGDADDGNGSDGAQGGDYEEVKIEPNTFTISAADQQHLIDYLLGREREDVHNDDGEEDVIFVDTLGNVVEENFPRPMDCAGDGLVKRENDSISGALPFRESVNNMQYKYVFTFFRYPFKRISRLYKL